MPRTIQGIAEALGAEKRMEFYRLVLAAEAGPDLDHVIATYWGHAMLDSDPEREHIVAATEAGTLPVVSRSSVAAGPRAERRLVSDHEEADIWPVEPSAAAGETLADLRLPADLFGKIVALTVAIAEDPWLEGSTPAPQGKHWRTAPSPTVGASSSIGST
ncbi:hypothetical protein [Streptomyces sp. I05A-00742]|uniref:hypothetical protein n=1 Tax=Streptomyces sp. I05A-00742 TaxID=2732853 RepID=UPI00148A08C1|nr:hypothetical protein [Streptomyces sp. I05A-00742]